MSATASHSEISTRGTSFSQPRFDLPSCWKSAHWECPGRPVQSAQEQYAQLNLTDAKMCKNLQCSVSQQSSRSRPNWLWLKPAMTHLLVADSSHFTTVPILVKAYRLVTVLEQTVRLCRPVVNLSAHLPWIKCVCQFIGSSSTVGCLLSGSLQPSLFFVKVCKVWIAECTPPSCKSIQKHVLLNVTRSITTIFSLVLVFTYPES